MKRFLSTLVFLLTILTVQADSSALVTWNSARTDVSFSTSGTYEWVWNPALGRLESSNQGVGNSTSLTTITLQVGLPCSLSFSYSVSSELLSDKFSVRLDGVLVINAISGSHSDVFSSPLGVGTHTLDLSYTKDGSLNNGDDCACVWDMRLEGVGVVPLFGDSNGDGQITEADLARLADMIAGKEPHKYLIEGRFMEGIPVGSINLNVPSDQIYCGETVALSASCQPADASVQTILWSSSDPAVATVDKGGTVRGIAPGSAIITAMATDGSEAKRYCTIDVADFERYNGHTCIDLGMMSDGHRVLWASCNIGAERPHDPGLFFAWGSTVGYSPEIAGLVGYSSAVPSADGYSFDWSSAPFNGGGEQFDESLFLSFKDQAFPDGVLAPAYDAACANWGGGWRMPTQAELEWLCDENNCSWTFDGSKSAFKVTSQITHQYIYLPLAGYRTFNDIYLLTQYCSFWSSTCNPKFDGSAISLDGAYNSIVEINVFDGSSCFVGMQVRPVCTLPE